MWKAIASAICAAFLLRATSYAAELTENTAFGPVPATPTDPEGPQIVGQHRHVLVRRPSR